MAKIFAHTNDGYVARINDATWADARINTSGTANSSTGTYNNVGVSAVVTPTRGGGTVFNIYRSFFFFDTSGISTDVDSATFKVYGRTFGDGDLIAVKSNSDIETLGNADYTAIVGWDASGTDGSGGGDNESNVTKYSSEISTLSTSGYNDIALRAQALADMRDDDTVYICLINFDYDLKDIEPTGYLNRNGFYYINNTGTSKDPYIDYTLKADNNAIFFGHNF